METTINNKLIILTYTHIFTLENMFAIKQITSSSNKVNLLSRYLSLGRIDAKQCKDGRGQKLRSKTENDFKSRKGAGKGPQNYNCVEQCNKRSSLESTSELSSPTSNCTQDFPSLHKNAQLECGKKFEDIQKTLEKIYCDQSEFGNKFQDIQKTLEKMYCETKYTREIIETCCVQTESKSSEEKEQGKSTSPSKPLTPESPPPPASPPPARPLLVCPPATARPPPIDNDCSTSCSNCGNQVTKLFCYGIGLAFLAHLAYCIYNHGEDRGESQTKEEESKTQEGQSIPP